MTSIPRKSAMAEFKIQTLEFTLLVFHSNNDVINDISYDVISDDVIINDVTRFKLYHALCIELQPI